MKIEHIAIWVRNLEAMKKFYTHYFGMIPNDKYENKVKNFTSYFLSFSQGARLELMHRPDISKNPENRANTFGLTHLAISLGSVEKVNALTEKMRNEGIQIIGEPRRTGDGYYESVVLDPEGNSIEITE